MSKAPLMPASRKLAVFVKSSKKRSPASTAWLKRQLNDPYVVAGQGTIAVELLRQLPDMDAIFIATGGGGLMSGIGSWLHARAPRADIIGCWPENSSGLRYSISMGR